MGRVETPFIIFLSQNIRAAFETLYLYQFMAGKGIHVLNCNTIFVSK